MQFSNLMSADNSQDRINALCQFIEYWVGPREPEFGELPEILDKVTLPDPLRQLYQFAGNWPCHRGNSNEKVVPLLACEHYLANANGLKHTDDGRIIFAFENQGCCQWSTNSQGNDPPVWCDDYDTDKIVCDSLSKFLVSFALGELISSSKTVLWDSSINDYFEAHIDSTSPLWFDDSSEERDQLFSLWGDVLVVQNSDGCPSLFATNSETGEALLLTHRSQIERVKISLPGDQWSFEIELNGAVKIRYEDWGSEVPSFYQRVDLPAQTMNFVELCDQLEKRVLKRYDHTTEPAVFFFREGYAEAVGLRDLQFAVDLFQSMLSLSGEDRKVLQHFEHQFPSE